jgi:hypothetical protein
MEPQSNVVLSDEEEEASPKKARTEPQSLVVVSEEETKPIACVDSSRRCLVRLHADGQLEAASMVPAVPAEGRADAEAVPAERRAGAEAVPAEGRADAEPSVPGLTYATRWDSNNRAWRVVQTNYGRKYILDVACKKLSKERLELIADAIIHRLRNGFSEAETKDWAKAEIRRQVRAAEPLMPGLQYRKTWSQGWNAWTVKQKNYGRNSVIFIGSQHLSKERLSLIADAALDRLHRGFGEAETKDWAPGRGSPSARPA